MSSTKKKIQKKSNTIYVKVSAKIEHHLWKRFWKNKTPSIERFCKNQTVYGKDSAKIRHHLWKIIYKNQTSSIEKILYKETPSIEKITGK
jgi:hypothetical protein